MRIAKVLEEARQVNLVQLPIFWERVFTRAELDSDPETDFPPE